VNLEAVAASGWVFEGWSGDASGSSNTMIVMDSNKTVTATFVEVQYIFADGFETGTLSAWSGTSATAPTVQASTLHCDTFAMRSTASSRSCYLTIAESTVNMRVYLYVDAADQSVELMRFVAGSCGVAFVKRTSTGLCSLVILSVVHPTIYLTIIG